MVMKPILFSTPMVQAIMDGRKSMTRRVINLQPTIQDRKHELYPPFNTMADNGLILVSAGALGEHSEPHHPGDVLWVRETWRIGAWNEDTQCIAVDYKDGTARREWLYVPDRKRFLRYVAQSIKDAEKAGSALVWEPGKAPTRWRSARFMPKEACRLFLRVTDVRAERLQEITANDCIKEGIDWQDVTPCVGAFDYRVSDVDYDEIVGQIQETQERDMVRTSFGTLWDHLNAKRGYGWDKNPWVWVYSFEQIQKPEGWTY